ncbi:hypothetical protein BGZ65_004264 [Modicella reniformis]|uniref:Fungal lipase-type domain-containing protein n=1 Tax=Modicella reniformis TaxID=1440133 RepID=A0A9P6STS8_9FUNG|nr:hypothetical protein BGZ65_004264 [Modicella reniformis]
MRFSDFLADSVALYMSYVVHPSQIPGNDLFSKVYAMGVLPVLIIALTVIQWSIGLLVNLVNHTRVGAHYYGIFFKDQIALFDETDFVDPEGNDEAVRQLVDRTPRQTTHFSYHIANLLLIMSSMAYQRDDKLVTKAFKILIDCQNQEQRDQAAALLQESERMIDDNACKEFGMHFMGISELKTLGGPFAGLFYNDDTIVLVFKGTSVLAFNEYLLDVTIQRVDASEYLYGEVHKGFHECLFPDPTPLNWYENMTYDQTNPFNTIMENIFEIAKIGKSRTGKPVNLWLTGHSLGGALAALTMARLQMLVKGDDPLMTRDHQTQNNANKKDSINTITVLEEMLARFSDDPELLVLRDCYTVASPKIGDSTFTEEFAHNHLRYCCQSPYKPTYWRIAADKDVVPHLPPGYSVDPNEPCDRLFPCKNCPKVKSWLEDTKNQGQQVQGQQQQQQQQEGSVGNKERKPINHMHSLLDYQHIGQLVKVFNAEKVPKVQPSPFEADLCEGVLRKKEDLQGLMKKLAKIAATWRTQEQIEVTVNASNNASNTTNTTKTTTKTTRTKTTTTIVSTTAIIGMSTCSTVDGDDERRIWAERVQQIADDIAKAQALYDLDELSRLRQPHIVERILLKIPSLLSHAPATYQRNLVRGRFHFKSFPGTEFEERLDQWLEQSETQSVSIDEGVEIASRDDDEQTQEEQPGVLGHPVGVDVDVNVNVMMGKNEGVLESGSNRTTEAAVATMTHTVSVHSHE